MSGLGLIFLGLVAGIVVGWLASPRRAVQPQTAPEDAADLRATLASLRHDLRSQLAPALLRADQLTKHDDETVRAHAGTVLQALESASMRLRAGGEPRAES